MYLVWEVYVCMKTVEPSITKTVQTGQQGLLGGNANHLGRETERSRWDLVVCKTSKPLDNSNCLIHGIQVYGFRKGIIFSDYNPMVSNGLMNGKFGLVAIDKRGGIGHVWARWLKNRLDNIQEPYRWFTSEYVSYMFFEEHIRRNECT